MLYIHRRHSVARAIYACIYVYNYIVSIDRFMQYILHIRPKLMMGTELNNNCNNDVFTAYFVDFIF